MATHGKLKVDYEVIMVFILISVWAYIARYSVWIVWTPIVRMYCNSPYWTYGPWALYIVTLAFQAI
jgi:hypothetical protein